MKKKIIRFIGISLLMVWCISIQGLQVQAGSTEIILQKTEQRIEVDEEKKQNDNSVKTGDNEQMAVYLVSLIVATTIGGSMIKKINERRKKGFED